MILLNLLLKIVFFFLVAQVLGIYAGVFLISDIQSNEFADYFTFKQTGVSSFLFFIFYIALGIGIMFLIIKLGHSILFDILEFAVISTTSSIIFYVFLKVLFFLPTIMAIFFAVPIAVLFALSKHFHPSMKNIGAVVASAGAGAVFGFSVGFFPAVILLILLSVYDFIAVFKTKHMLTFAKQIISRNLSFTIDAIEISPEGKERRMDLGTGDIALPIMLEVSAFHIAPMLSFLLFIGAVIGALSVMVYAWKTRSILPALPPITLSMFIMGLIGFLLGLI